MRTWRSILHSITFVLLALAIIFWLLTLTGWLITEPGFEPLNVLAGAIVSSLGVLLGLLGAHTAKDTPVGSVLEYKPTPAPRERMRRTMLKSVKNFWVKGYLEQSLHGAAMIELGLEYEPDAVEHPWDIVLQTPDQPNRPLPRGTKIVEVFDEMNRALLILGEPGSGKTTMLLELARDTIARAEKELLELARDTIARAEKDFTQSIPVVLNLSSWSGPRQSIGEWLVDELNDKYNIPKKDACLWVENDELLLLLDGLDEVAQEYRKDCVRAINDFRQEHMVPLVVCSRIADYEALTTRLRLQGAVFLQPLTPQQVDEYLDRAGADLAAVREALQDDATLQELVETPLMLSIMTLAYQGMSVQDLGALDSIKAHRRHVFEAYVQRMFKRRGGDKRYAPRQTIRWLAWLAQKMSQHYQTVFSAERMQLSWLQTDTQRRLHTTISSLIGRLMGGLTLGMIGGLIGGLTLGLIMGLVGGLISGLRSQSTRWPKPEVLSWSFSIGQSLILGLIFVLVSRLNGGLIFGLILGLGASLPWSPIHYPDVPRSQRSPRPKSVRPLVRIVRLVAGPIAGGLIVWLIGVLRNELLFGLALGLISKLDFGGIQHFILRFILYCNGHIPWNYTRFLDYAAERIFLRKVGREYIFVHRLLQDYFASL